ncbi:MAG: cytochrome c oxidase accessory protein CcoG [Marinilabiliaceae bacterium]|nr:cytochrome c oxidase accessory protein CcoG [Marinilabiliaceae bacterium]
MTNEANNSFRDRVVTMNAEGHRKWVYASQPKGKLYNARTLVSLVLLFFFFSAPFLQVADEPLLLFDILRRKFVLFGVVFWPQDFHLFVIGLITIIITVVTFTVVYGRIWCGWTCPQTIFMEMVFRRIEFWIEGGGNTQRKRLHQKDHFDRIWRKVLKHVIFVLISLIVIHTFIAYVVGIDKVKEYLTSPPSENMSLFIATMAFSGLFYFIFAYFREQVCSLVCPYGRLQGALLDGNTLMVTYDFKRGEKRSYLTKGEDREAAGKGDCINCGKCSSVCPTGIDIRNGIQLECINCTSCIDACNSVMTKIGKPKGLVRITSQNRIVSGEKFKWTGRIRAYTFLLVALVGVLVVLFNIRSDFETTILRVQGTLYQKLEDGRYSNIYNFKVVNKTNEDMHLNIRLLAPQGELQLAGTDMALKKQAILQGVFLLKMEKAQLTGLKTDVELGIYTGDELIETITTTFVGTAK